MMMMIMTLLMVVVIITNGSQLSWFDRGAREQAAIEGHCGARGVQVWYADTSIDSQFDFHYKVPVRNDRWWLRPLRQQAT